MGLHYGLMSSLIKLREAAEVLGITYDRAHTLTRNGILPPGVVVRIGGSIRVHRNRLEKWIEDGGSQSRVSGQNSRTEASPCAQ